MARVVTTEQLPHHTSTRDTRHRIHLVTEKTCGLTELQADRITYHPGDTAAAHYHRDAKHFFFILEGRGVMRADGDPIEVAAGDVALVDDDELHWFANPFDAEYTCIELLLPAPSATVWIGDDKCTRTQAVAGYQGPAAEET